MAWVSKIERAKRHQAELQGIIEEFLQHDPYRVEFKRGPDGQGIYFLAGLEDVPADVPAITGDVIQNLRSALDQLAYELFRKASGPKPDARNVYFPISKDKQAYQKAKRDKTHGMSPAAKTLIDDTQPYRGGNDVLWRIHELNNIDKHRLLVTVGSRFHSFDVGAVIRAQLRKSRLGMEIPDMGPLFLGASSEDHAETPLVIGEELYIDGEDAEPNPEIIFRFNVSLMEPGIVNGEPVLEVLQQMVDEVERLVPIFQGQL